MPTEPMPPTASPAARAVPRLAVLIPVFNGQSDLDRSFKSLVEENEQFDVILVDDGSSPPIAIPEGLPFAVTSVRLDRNRGITGALNCGLEWIAAAGYEYVARLDAGDISLPGRFGAQLAFLDAHPDHAVVGTFAEIVDEDGRHLYEFRRPTAHAGLVRELCYRNGLCHPSVMMRMRALLDAGFYSGKYVGGEDYELWLRLARRYRIANIDCVFVRKEEGQSSISARRLRLGLSRIRLQSHHLSPLSVHSYLGIARSIFMLCLSRNAVLRLLRVRARLFRHSAIAGRPAD
jgi:glycosyltransferase involved in cell wall biosynthesis